MRRHHRRGKQGVPVFRLGWPDDIRRMLVTESNPGGTLSISDFEMAGMLVLFLVMEAVCSLGAGMHVLLYSNNQPTVPWSARLTSKSSDVAGQLIRALALRMKQKRVSPMTPMHVRGVENPLADVPSRSFWGKPEWHCRINAELQLLFDNSFPLPNKNSCSVFSLSREISTKVFSVLQTKATSADVWRRLPSTGKLVGGTGGPLCSLWDWTLTCGAQHSLKQQGPSQGSQEPQDVAIMVAERKCAVARFQARSRPLARRSPWCSEKTPPS